MADNNMNAETEVLISAGAKAHEVANDIRAALGKLRALMGELRAGWIGTAPVVLQEIHDRLDNRLTLSAQDMDTTAEKVTSAAVQYRASQEQATQDVAAANAG